jgi:hypothetical protein
MLKPAEKAERAKESTQEHAIAHKNVRRATRHKKTRRNRAGLSNKHAGAGNYFNASNARSRISSTVPRPEMRRYCGAFSEVDESPFCAQLL